MTDRQQPTFLSIVEADAERLYDAIYAHLRQTQTLPKMHVLTSQLTMKRERATHCVELLRELGRIAQTTLLPTDYGQTWRDTPRLADWLDAER